MNLKDIDTVQNRLEAAKKDTRDSTAEIVDGWVELHAGDDGLILEFERTSGERMTRWFELPGSWQPGSDLIALLCYLGLDPEEDDLTEMEGLMVPVRYSDSDSWSLDWKLIENNADLPERAFR